MNKERAIITELLKTQKAMLVDYQKQVDALIEALAKEDEEPKEKFASVEYGKRGFDVCEMTPESFEESCLQMAKCVKDNMSDKFSDTRFVLKHCYQRMNKEYSAGLDIKRREYKRETGCWTNSTLSMIARFSGDYAIYKSVLYSILENMVGDAIEYAEKKNLESKMPKKMVDESTLPKKVAYKDECTAIVIPSKVEAATTFDEAQGQIALASKLHNIKPAAIYSQIYAKIEENNGKINWCNYRYNFRKRNNLRSSVAIPKKTLIKNSPKLSKLFVKETNKFIESCNEKESA